MSFSVCWSMSFFSPLFFFVILAKNLHSNGRKFFKTSKHFQFMFGLMIPKKNWMAHHTVWWKTNAFFFSIFNCYKIANNVQFAAAKYCKLHLFKRLIELQLVKCVSYFSSSFSLVYLFWVLHFLSLHTMHIKKAVCVYVFLGYYRNNILIGYDFSKYLKVRRLKTQKICT